jgi:hypothetical protein
MGFFKKLVSAAAPIVGSIWGPAGMAAGAIIGQSLADKPKPPELPPVRAMPTPDDPEKKRKRMRDMSRRYRNMGRAGTHLQDSGGRLG